MTTKPTPTSPDDIKDWVGFLNQRLLYFSHGGMDFKRNSYEAFLAFKVAVERFKPDGEASFGTFLNRAVQNFVMNVQAKRSRRLGKTEYLGLQLEYINVGNGVAEKILNEEYLDWLSSCLTPNEHKMFEMRSQGYNFKDIKIKGKRKMKTPGTLIVEYSNALKKLRRKHSESNRMG